MVFSEEIVVKADRLKAFCVGVYEKLGLSKEDAEIGSDALVEAELRGKSIQGVAFLPYYADRIQDGSINPRPRIRVLTDASALLLLDGDKGLGQVIATRAMRMAIDRADEQGMSMVAVRNSNDFAMAGYYVLQALERDMIGFCATSTPSVIPPFGGVDRVLGQGPTAWAIPAGTEPPIVVDLTHAVAPIGRIRVAAGQGMTLPEGYTVDSEGEPVLDPNEALKNITLVPIGAHKGYGLITVIETLTGILTGAMTTASFQPSAAGRSSGQVFMAVKVSALMPIGEFKAGVDRLVQQIKASRPRKGISRVYVPGERSRENREHRMRHGVPLLYQTYEALQTLGKKVGATPLVS